MTNSAVVIAGLSSVSPEEHSLIIRDVPPDERGQFRIHWNANTFYLLFRSDKVFNCTVHRAYFTDDWSNAGSIKSKRIPL